MRTLFHGRGAAPMRLALLGAISVVLGLAFADARPAPGVEPEATQKVEQEAAQKADPLNRYIGASKCQSCHSSDAAGNPYGTWQKAKHSMAYASLASDAAKAFAKERGIPDPQKAPECLKCHVTGYGAPEGQIKKGFLIEQGVQCESCHGPGEAHMKARFAAAAKGGPPTGEYTPVPAGEILVDIQQDTCLKCHNEESPSFKPFCFHKFKQEIAHVDPRKPRKPGELTDCGCGDPCACVHGCPDDGCAVPRKGGK